MNTHEMYLFKEEVQTDILIANEVIKGMEVFP